jgi:predicted ribosome quality control (RQC) complex YloA/Tae2 family protein
MHNNYFLLRQLAAELNTCLNGSIVSECFSQNKDELIIRFETTEKSFFIKASLVPEFCCLSFPESFNRARKNSVDLFGEIIGQRVSGVTSFRNERCFSIELSAGFLLLFKMHGNRSNVVLFHNQQPTALFRNHLRQDLSLQIEELNKEIDWSRESFLKNRQNLKQHYFTFGKVVWHYLETEHINTSSADEQWKAIQDIRKRLEAPSYYITELEGRLILSLLPIGTIQTTHTSAVLALRDFFVRYSVQTGFLKEKQAAHSALSIRLKNTENYMVKAGQKLTEIESDNHYRLWADLIMANLHLVKPQLDTLELPDFYQDQKPVTVKLKKELSGQKNAELYYRKAKNHHIEVTKLKESIARKQREEETLRQYLEQVHHAADVMTLRQVVTQAGLTKVSRQTEAPLPYHEVEFKGFKIWVGKNAKSNDVLTLKHTYKEDLWLHAKDVAGSHVVVKHQAGKKFPNEVIERAAQLAAYHSKRKTDSLCPVAVTQKKYIRKRKGDAPGAVRVEREDVIMVEPVP